MTLRQSFPTDSTSGQSVTDTRLTNAALVVRDAAGVPRPGVVFDSSARIVSPTASMAYLVRDLRAVTMRTPGGVEFVANDGAVTVPTTAAPASNSRIDVDRAREAGAAGYVTKDRIAAELVDAILEVAS